MGALDDLFLFVFFSLEVYVRGKFVIKAWFLAPPTLKSMGAEAPTAPKLSGALPSQLLLATQIFISIY